MFSRAARDSQVALEEKVTLFSDQNRRLELRTQLIEKGISVPFKSVAPTSSEEKVSNGAIAARSGLIKIVVAKAKLAATAINDGGSLLPQLIQEGWDLAMAFVISFAGRGKKSLQTKTLNLLSRSSLGGGNSRRSPNGVVLSLTEIMVACRDEYSKLTGNAGTMYNLRSTPNFLSHLIKWAFASSFQGNVYTKKFTKCDLYASVITSLKLEEGMHLLFKHEGIDGGCTIGTGVISLTAFDEKNKFLSMSTTWRWFTGEPDKTNTPITLVLGNKAGENCYMVSSVSMLGGTITILGKKTDSIPYYEYWMDAMAIPAEEGFYLSYIVHWWKLETDKRINQLRSVDPTLAVTLSASFTTHNLSWFLAQKLTPIRARSDGQSPFLNTSLGKWEEIAEGLEKVGKVIGIALMEVEEMLDKGKGEILLENVINVWRHIFSAPEEAVTWQSYQDRRRAYRRDHPDKKVIDEMEIRADFSAEQIGVIDEIRGVQAGIKQLSSENPNPSYKLILRGINSQIVGATYIAGMDLAAGTPEVIEEKAIAEFAMKFGFSKDFREDPTWGPTVEFVRGVFGLFDITEERDLTGEVYRVFTGGEVEPSTANGASGRTTSPTTFGGDKTPLPKDKL